VGSSKQSNGTNVEFMNPEERINQIKNNIRELMREILSVGEEPPEEIQDMLLQVIERAQGQINELRQ